MERTDCNICGSSEGQKFLEKDGFSIVRCPRCHLVYTNPRYNLDELMSFYEESYHEFEKESPLQSAKARRITERLWKMTGGSRLLDIGCSTGIFLNEARRRFEVQGVELARWSADFARRNRGLRVSNSTLAEAHFENEQFDAITFFEVIEHLHDPLTFLREVNRIVRMGGVVALSTGNLSSAEAMIRKEKWYYFAPKFHLYYFSLQTLELILIKAGFKLVRRTGSEALTILDFLRIASEYNSLRLFGRQGLGKIRVGRYSVGCIGVYARKVTELR